ncbi:MAG: mandelate racemase/muconate lactonizing enzyme family protein [bacterium]|nr:mandelate racemase/muconate lactonizing enzyme family protein [bacterium]
MKITSIKTYLVHPGTAKNWLFVKLETDEGIHGWGEAYTQSDRDCAIETHIRQLGRYLVGRSPFDIKHFTFIAYTDFASKRGSMDLYSAISGLEQALWDIVGKALNQPVYNLLGGQCRNKIKVYANGWGSWYDPGKTLEALANRARAVVERGFKALKFDPFPGPWRSIIERKEEQEAVERIRTVREAVGPDVDILVEVHRRLSPMHAIRVARQMEPYRPFWYEEPVSSRDPGGLAAAAKQINIPVVTGEELYTKNEFRDIFEQRSVDIINPDVCNCGGILELREIAAMAESYHVAVSPHNYNSTTVGLAATLHACAGMPNFLITEYFLNFEEIGNEIAISPFKVEDGYIHLPTTPGLGIELDEQALEKYPYQEFPTRTLRHPADEGP